MQQWIQVKKSYEERLCTVQKEKIQRSYEEFSILGELNLKKKSLSYGGKKLKTKIDHPISCCQKSYQIA